MSCRDLEDAYRGLKAEHVYGGRSRRGNELLEPRIATCARCPSDRAQHEETGRKSLYANPTHIVRIQGLADSESEKLIAELTTIW